MPSAPPPDAAADESLTRRRRPPPLTLAVIADVQYADKPATLVRNSYGPYVRHYQGCLAVFSRVVRRLNRDAAASPAPPVGLLHLGDIVDGSPTVARSLSDLTTVLRTFDRCRLPVFHVVGNHCLSVGRPVLQSRVAAFRPSFYYARRIAERWTLVVMDTCDVSVNGADAERTRQAEDWLAARPDAPNNRRWNGGVGREQMGWLRGVLASLSRGTRQYAVVATHMPLLARAADPVHVIFNGDEVSSLLDSHRGVVRLVMSGHFHRGGEAVSDAGVRHRTLRGIVEDGGLEYLTLRGDGSFEFTSQPC